MALEDFLRPSESIQYRSADPVEYQGERYDFYISSARLMWHRRTGFLFKKDAFVAAALGSVREISYKETGTFVKKAVITFEMKEGLKRQITGTPASVRAIYSEIQPFMEIPELKEPIQ